MQKLLPTRAAVAIVLLSHLCIPVSFADAWHQFGNEDAYWHHGSGWIFLRHVGTFELVRTPYQIDGNDDVGADYEMNVNGVRGTAQVVIYYPSSAASGARLDTARAAIQSSSTAGKTVTLKSEGKLAIRQRPGIVGVRTSYTLTEKTGNSELGLYLFQAADWIVTIRTTTQAADKAAAAKAVDAFVQNQRWGTLGTDSGRYQ